MIVSLRIRESLSLPFLVSYSLIENYGNPELYEWVGIRPLCLTVRRILLLKCPSSTGSECNRIIIYWWSREKRSVIIEYLKQNINGFKQTLSPQMAAIKKELKKKSEQMDKSLADKSTLTPKDQQLLHQINERTRRLNANNVTRTTAYYNFYARHPEIHWALLGHMVSRNGGWNMTDLKGELVSRLLSEEEGQAFFAFLERGNWLIFQDVYPQFLLYEEGLNRKSNLFHLLPFCRVSTFMETIWNHFWKNGNPYLLAIALIVNEQSYLEQRVIRHPEYQKTVLQTIQFKLQDILGLNQILFPFYNSDEKESALSTGIIGQTLRQFASLHERIMLGKRLYAIIFNNSDLWRKVRDWASDHPHTGSRKDYWPHLFNDVNESVPGAPYKRRLDHCRLRESASRLYSPALRYAWDDVEHEKADGEDWFADWKIIRYFTDRENQTDGEIHHAYCETLEKIELAVMAKSTIFQQ